MSLNKDTALFFDSRCLLHSDSENHVENFNRILTSYRELVNHNLWNRCKHLTVQGASFLDEIDENGMKLLYNSSTPEHPYYFGPEIKIFNDIDPLLFQNRKDYLLEFEMLRDRSITDLTIVPQFNPLYSEPVPLLSPDDLNQVHPPVHIDKLVSLSLKHSFTPPEPSDTHLDAIYPPECRDVYINRFSYSAATVAASGVVGLAKAVCKGDVKNAFALVRPPGHHASPSRMDGFCLFNNVALAAEHALTLPHIGRVLVLDFDVHHGNGTQDCFYNRDDVMFVSIHKFAPGFFPCSGDADEVGVGKGKGYNINVPVPVDVSDAEYYAAWCSIILPAVQSFQPDFVVLSAGFDCMSGDPLGGMSLSDRCMYNLTRSLMHPSVCPSGRLLAVLEGGYNVDNVALGSCAVVQALLGDPYVPRHPNFSFTPLSDVGENPTETTGIGNSTEITENPTETTGNSTDISPKDVTEEKNEDSIVIAQLTSPTPSSYFCIGDVERLPDHYSTKNNSNSNRVSSQSLSLDSTILSNDRSLVYTTAAMKFYRRLKKTHGVLANYWSCLSPLTPIVSSMHALKEKDILFFMLRILDCGSIVDRELNDKTTSTSVNKSVSESVSESKGDEVDIDSLIKATTDLSIVESTDNSSSLSFTPTLITPTLRSTALQSSFQSLMEKEDMMFKTALVDLKTDMQKAKTEEHARIRAARTISTRQQMKEKEKQEERDGDRDEDGEFEDVDDFDYITQKMMRMKLNK